MPHTQPYDAVVIGAGPNGLAAAVTLARAGHSVLVIEAAATVGGGTRTAGLTLPGFCHDICSAVHPLTLSSSFFRDLPLHRYGLRWIEPPLPLAHPLDDGTAIALERSVAATAAGLGRDAAAYGRLMGPLVRRWAAVTGQLVASLDELPSARARLFDVSPINLVRIAGDRLPAACRRRLARYRHGPAALKLDWALDGPIPWAADACRRAGTVHLGGTLDELARSERAAWRGAHPEAPYPTTWAATSSAAYKTCRSSPPGRCSAATHTPRPRRASTCARRPPRPAAACTACAAITRRRRRCGKRHNPCGALCDVHPAVDHLCYSPAHPGPLRDRPLAL